MVDTIRAHPFYAKALLLALQLGEPGRIAKALCAEAGYYAIAGAHYRNKAEDVLQMARLSPRRVAVITVSAWCQPLRAWRPSCEGIGSALPTEWSVRKHYYATFVQELRGKLRLPT